MSWSWVWDRNRFFRQIEKVGQSFSALTTFWEGSNSKSGHTSLKLSESFSHLRIQLRTFYFHSKFRGHSIHFVDWVLIFPPKKIQNIDKNTSKMNILSLLCPSLWKEAVAWDDPHIEHLYAFFVYCLLLKITVFECAGNARTTHAIVVGIPLFTLV